MEETLSRADVDIGAVTDDVHVVSNRQPYRHEYGEDGDVEVDRPTGGLTAGLDPVMQQLGGTWTAWGDGDADFAVSDDGNAVAVPPEDPSYTLQRIPLSEEEVAGYYEGYANQTLWPLCHSAMGNVRFDHDDWEEYRSVNRKFGAVVAAQVDDDSTVWFQDYHFGLAPRFVRGETDAVLMQFWHIPWPSADVFRVAPNAEELLDGLLANDLLGFHVPRYCANFLECAEELVDDAVVDWSEDRVLYGDRATRVEAFPLNVDADSIAEQADAAPDAGARVREEFGIDPDRPIALGVDRLDYTKGIPERLDALEHLWETRPDLRGAFTYVQKGEESRQGIEAYRELQAAVEERVDRINERFGTDDWQPVVSTTEFLEPETLYGLYRDAEVALVTPVRDGMNLVAKEYVAAQDDGDAALVLSRFTGAHEELGDGAIVVNPHDTPATADAIARAFEMDGDERSDRTLQMRQAVDDGGVTEWIDSVFETAAAVAEERRSSA
ncbi:trehalose-6-phosphate synthase [Natronomonas salina]|uniref:alpha,alpha-trehalose-phosphate synthase (UDP-forming) n=1 Tax=Natronomonas salina TaxID=1710540 RepID=UPI0015B5E28A|nr:trehalose-6-phosphate synthase [Natronomonas salina]QLD90130.1 trehalose-6-phosphate synthase [Natronomonas salina]